MDCIPFFNNSIQDLATEVRTVENCGMTVKWGKEIESNYGWQKGWQGRLTFNPTGFRPGDIFASCEFQSNPPTEVSWSSAEVGAAGTGKIQAKVPAENILLPEFIECSMEKDKTQYKDDHCKDTPIRNAQTITSPPSKLQYAEDVQISDDKKVWYYVSIFGLTVFRLYFLAAIIISMK